MLRVMRALLCVAILLAPPSALAQRFQAPSGPLGAGLSLAPQQTGRVYAEMSARINRNDIQRGSAFPLVFGGGYKPIAPLELQVQLPVGISIAPSGPNFDDPELSIEGGGGVALGNLQLLVHALLGNETIRLKAGLSVAYGPWTTDDEGKPGYKALRHSRLTRLEDEALWLSETVALNTPVRLEYNPIKHLLLSGDAALGFYFPTDGDENAVTVAFAPGASFVSKYIDLGGRFPTLIALAGPTLEADDRAQVAFEPYVRANLGKAFLNARWTIYLDDPLGFAFDQGGVWALHFGGGAGF